MRDAAGQLIENVVKSVRRKQEIDSDYMENLYSEVRSLYHLNENGAASSGKMELGELPKTAVYLLAALAVVWFFIILYVILEKIRKNRLK